MSSTHPVPVPPPPALDETLPEGWTRHYDDRGRPYYHDNVSNRTTWMHPTYAQSPPPPPPPPEFPAAFPPQTHLPHMSTPSPTLPHHPQHNFPPSPYQQPILNHQYSNPLGSHVPSPQTPQFPYYPPGPMYSPGFPTPPANNNMGYPPMDHQQQGMLVQRPSMGAYGYPPMSQPSILSNPSSISSGKVAHISLELSARGLKNKDLVGRSDPVCHLLVPNKKMLAPTAGEIQWVLHAKTEVLQNNTSPSWVTRIKVPYFFEQYQPLKFYLIDVDNPKTGKGDFLGQVVTHLAELVTKSTSHLTLTDRTGRPGKFGVLTVNAHDESQSTKVRVKVQFAGKKLDKKDLFGKSDPYFMIYHVKNNRNSKVYTSAYIQKTLNPAWTPDSFMLHTHGESWDQVRLRCEVFDYDKYTPHDLIGIAEFSLARLKNASSFPLINPKKVNKPRYVNSGELIVHSVQPVQMPTFTQFLLGGLRLEFIVAVDFTSSNGPATDPQSLHYMGDPMAPSLYYQALHGIGSVLESYVPDNQFTALGFGAILPQEKAASFDFALSGQAERVIGVQGLLEAYKTALANVTLSGPTNFTPLIRNAMGLCKAQPVSQSNQHFCVLLIITDGIITDMAATVDTIIDASYDTPIAIVIVGVGNANFAAMQRLDGDNQVLTSNDGLRKAKHDIVQFTEFKSGQSVEELAENVLQEVPSRVVDFMVDAGISPGVRV